MFYTNLNDYLQTSDCKVVYTHKTWVMSVSHHFLKIFLVLRPFLLDPDPYCFCLDPDQSSPWIRIRNKFFYILDPDPYQNDTDPPHCLPVPLVKDETFLKLSCFSHAYQAGSRTLIQSFLAGSGIIFYRIQPSSK